MINHSKFSLILQRQKKRLFNQEPLFFFLKLTCFNSKDPIISLKEKSIQIKKEPQLKRGSKALVFPLRCTRTGHHKQKSLKRGFRASKEAFINSQVAFRQELTQEPISNHYLFRASLEPQKRLFSNQVNSRASNIKASKEPFQRLKKTSFQDPSKFFTCSQEKTVLKKFHIILKTFQHTIHIEIVWIPSNEKKEMESMYVSMYDFMYGKGVKK